MSPFYLDLKNVPIIKCNLTQLKSEFDVKTDQYFHRVFDKHNHIWLSRDFEDWLETLGLFVRRIEIFHTEPNRITGWHTDMSPPVDWVKINWVYEEGISYMEWAELPQEMPSEIRKTMAGTPFLRFEPETVDVACQHQLKGPTLVNVGRPHRISNQKNTVRWALSTIIWYIDKQKRVTWDEAVEIFKEYL